MGLGIVALILNREKRESEARKRLQLDPRASGNAIGALADSMLLWASEQNVTQLRIFRRENAVINALLIGEEWHEYATFPPELLKSIENEFIMRAQNGAIAISPNRPRGIENSERDFESGAVQNARFALRILIEPPHEEILLTRI